MYVLGVDGNLSDKAEVRGLGFYDGSKGYYFSVERGESQKQFTKRVFENLLEQTNDEGLILYTWGGPEENLLSHSVIDLGMTDKVFVYNLQRIYYFTGNSPKLKVSYNRRDGKRITHEEPIGDAQRIYRLMDKLRSEPPIPSNSKYFDIYIRELRRTKFGPNIEFIFRNSGILDSLYRYRNKRN